MVLGLVLTAPIRRRLRVVGISGAMAAAAMVAGMPHVMPLAYLLVGYWLPASLVNAPSARVEEWLLSIDRQLFGQFGIVSFVRGVPRVVLEYLELSYLLCYAVPAVGYFWLRSGGFDADSERFWTAVLLASFLCYGVLPWLPSRAPRVIEAGQMPSRSAVRRMNLAVLDRMSVQWNTFPSGHTAASLATAMAVAVHIPVAGAVLGLVAVSIAAGSVVGRYHYAADAIAGAAVAVLAFVTASAALGL